MIYFKEAFANYEEFKQLFGMQDHGNGNKSRRNKILLSLFKSREILHMVATPCERYMFEDNRWRHHVSYPFFYDNPYSEARSMASMKTFLLAILRGKSAAHEHLLHIPGLEGIWSGIYASDDFKGLCEDGDERSVRYVNVERGKVFKMRAGKFLRKLIEENEYFDSILPEQVKIWLCEDFAEQWKAYAAENICRGCYELHVDDNFADIYDSCCCKGDFGSCMVDDGYWTFYRDSVDAKAAYLTDNDGHIVARCIIYTRVHDANGNILRLAERQYSSGCDESLKRILVMRLIADGHIDGYKQVGADCHSPRAFVDIHGDPLDSEDLWISCNLEDFDTVSYQDSFKSYEDGRAYNSDDIDNLSVTNGERTDAHNGDVYSEYNDEYIDEDDAYYVETREDYFYSSQVVSAYVGGYEEWCFEDDCIEIDGSCYYAGRNCESPGDYGIYECPECGEWYRENDGYYSELTDEDYCCESCLQRAEQKYREENWTYSEYDDEYFEDASEVVNALVWNELLSVYEPTTIHEDTLAGLIDDGCATEIGGNVYIDDICFDGEPAHFVAEMAAA